MALVDLADWLAEFGNQKESHWYIKRLSGNDTLANGSHQAGPYIPREFLFRVFSQLNRPDIKNPHVEISAFIDSHAQAAKPKAIWYNAKVYLPPEILATKRHPKNEVHFTGWGGGGSAVLDPDSTGSLAVFVFLPNNEGGPEARVWICDDTTQEDVIEEMFGAIEPGMSIIWRPGQAQPLTLFSGILGPAPKKHCRLQPHEIPPDWLKQFPNGLEIVQKSVEMRPLDGKAPSERLICRRACEYEIFLSVEQAVEEETVRRGFDNVEALLAYARPLMQRRMSRSGRSLELQTREILIEEKFEEGVGFSHGKRSEGNKRPDFLFPSDTRYRDSGYPDGKLRMLAVKTSCKDRWRQILNEADRIQKKHLLTLQEGVSKSQFAEMTDAGVQLVVPNSLIDSFAAPIRPHLMTLESFIADIRLLPT